ncbi:MAG: sigma-54 interaction domain-containing protein [Chitinophagales bacterium]
MASMNQQLQSIKARFGIIGASPPLDAALETALRVAPTDLTVLITGESGVGKEAFSKIIHSVSPRKHNDFIAINGGAIPEGTINSELFGHEKGAFTGAIGERKGYFETVNGGTIFLDEIGELPLDTQAFLLRLLENGEFLKVGSSKVEKTDVRVIAATNVNLEERVRNGKFREDLYYRLNTVPIRVPALHQRRGDIPLLFRKFAYDFAEKYRMDAVRLDKQAEGVLEAYRWPGNIRELKNVAEQLSVLSENRELDAAALIQLMPQLLQRDLPMATTGPNSFKVDDFQERDILYKVLFDLKSDLNDLKALIFELVSSNNLHMPDLSRLRSLPSGSFENKGNGYVTEYSTGPYPTYVPNEGTKVQPIVLDTKRQGATDTYSIGDGEVVEGPITLSEIEKEAIKRALKKYKGKRKEVAEELKISERTLYRKINEYNLQSIS